MGAGHAHALFVHEHSVIHGLPSQVKVAAAFVFVLIVAVTPREEVWAFGFYLLALAILIPISNIGFRFVLLRLTTIVPFVAFAFLIPFIATGEQVTFGWISVSRDGLWASWNIIAKASLGAATSIMLAATTEIPDILSGMARLRVPVAFTSIAGFMVRYLELIAGEIGRIRMAMTARGYDPSWLGQAKPIASSAGTMFIRAYERGERVYDAMVARGFTGTMPEIRRRNPKFVDWALAAALPVFAGIVLLVSVALP